MFINLTNHTSSLWSNKQKQAAKEYGEIIDIPFPAVDPSSDTDSIIALSSCLVKQIVDISNRTQETIFVHIMGEMSLTFYTVSLLQKMRYTVLHSTTERIVQKNDLGIDVSVFSFVRFRIYPPIG